MNTGQKLVRLPGIYTIHRLTPGDPLPEIKKGFHSITSTEDEISIVCPEEVKVDSGSSSPGWICLQMEGPLELEQVGILHGITSTLKAAGISLFVISTYDTDYILIPVKDYSRASSAFSTQYIISEEN